MSNVSPRLRLEALRLSRFGMVGAAATVSHLLLASILITGTTLPILAANTVAFLTAFGISLTGHYCWTFQKPGDLRRAAIRFMLVSVSAFACNTLALALALNAGWFTPLVTTLLAAAVIPLATYLASRLWAFRAPTP